MPEKRAHLRLTHLRGGEAIYNAGESFGPRVLSDFEFVYIADGGAVYHVDGEAHDAPVGSIVLGRPGSRERYEWDRRAISRHLFFHFDFADLPRDWPAIEEWPLVQTFEVDAPAAALFRYIVQTCASFGSSAPPSPAATRAVAALVDLFIAKPVSTDAELRGSLPSPVATALRWAQRTIERKPDTSIDLDALADVASVSPAHLCRLFNESIGASPMQVVRRIRLRAALMLVTRSNLTVQQVAARCGFASPYHFSRSFSNLYGKPPTQVRADVLAGAAPPEVAPW